MLPLSGPPTPSRVQLPLTCGRPVTSPSSGMPGAMHAFARAQAEDKPILLDIGAVWCHWCHVMDRESYEDPELARIINDHLRRRQSRSRRTARRRRPLSGRRLSHQRARVDGHSPHFSLPTAGPILVVRTFRRDDRYGTAGLWTCAAHHGPGLARPPRRSARVRSQRHGRHRAQRKLFRPRRRTVSGPRRQDRRIGLRQFDPRNGGFGSQPKFPHPAALDLLLEVAVESRQRTRLAKPSPSRSKRWRAAASMTRSPAASIATASTNAGSFPTSRRCSTTTPSFCATTYTAFRALCAKTFCRRRLEIVAWLDIVMTDRERGGFYASQDADINLDDDGDYFTWTLEEARCRADRGGT